MCHRDLTIALRKLGNPNILHTCSANDSLCTCCRPMCAGVLPVREPSLCSTFFTSSYVPGVAVLLANSIPKSSGKHFAVNCRVPFPQIKTYCYLKLGICKLISKNFQSKNAYYSGVKHKIGHSLSSLQSSSVVYMQIKPSSAAWMTVTKCRRVLHVCG